MSTSVPSLRVEQTGIHSSGFRLLLPHIAGQWRLLVAIVLMTALAAGIISFQPLPAKVVIDSVLGGKPLPPFMQSIVQSLGLGSTREALLLLGALASLFVYVLKAANNSLVSWAWAVAGRRMVNSLEVELYTRLQSLTPRFYSRSHLGDSLGRLTSDTWSVYTLASDLLISPAQRLFTMSTLAVIGWELDPQLTVVVFAVAPAMAIATSYFGNALKARAHSSREAESSLLSFVHQTLEAIPMVQAFDGRTAHGREFDRLASHAASVSGKKALLNSSFGFVSGLITTTGATIVLAVGAHRVLGGTLPLGSLLVFLAYVRSLESLTDNLLKTFGKIKEVQASVERVAEILVASDFVAEAAKPVPLPAPSDNTPILEVTSLTFGYDPGRPVLRGVDFVLGPNETLAVLGPTGAGKSTIISLILRLVDPWEGAIRFCGTDIRSLRLSEWRRQVSVVFQEPFLLPVTVSQNIAVGRPNASREEIEVAARAAGADTFIRALPDGYDTVLHERGASLSGGERQRIAIARAFLRNSPILILDEPTASLDAKSEGELLKAMESLTRGRATIVITHRLSTVGRADRVLIVDHGRIIESGSPQELLSSGGRFEHFHALQHHASGEAE